MLKTYTLFVYFRNAIAISVTLLEWCALLHLLLSSLIFVHRRCVDVDVDVDVDMRVYVY